MWFLEVRLPQSRKPNPTCPAAHQSLPLEVPSQGTAGEQGLGWPSDPTECPLFSRVLPLSLFLPNTTCLISSILYKALVDFGPQAASTLCPTKISRKKKYKQICFPSATRRKEGKQRHTYTNKYLNPFFFHKQRLHNKNIEGYRYPRADQTSSDKKQCETRNQETRTSSIKGDLKVLGEEAKREKGWICCIFPFQLEVYTSEQWMVFPFLLHETVTIFKKPSYRTLPTRVRNRHKLWVTPTWTSESK